MNNLTIQQSEIDDYAKAAALWYKATKGLTFENKRVSFNQLPYQVKKLIADSPLKDDWFEGRDIFPDEERAKYDPKGEGSESIDPTVLEKFEISVGIFLSSGPNAPSVAGALKDPASATSSRDGMIELPISYDPGNYALPLDLSLPKPPANNQVPPYEGKVQYFLRYLLTHIGEDPNTAVVGYSYLVDPTFSKRTSTGFRELLLTMAQNMDLQNRQAMAEEFIRKQKDAIPFLMWMSKSQFRPSSELGYFATAEEITAFDDAVFLDFEEDDIKGEKKEEGRQADQGLGFRLENYVPPTQSSVKSEAPSKEEKDSQDQKGNGKAEEAKPAKAKSNEGVQKPSFDVSMELLKRTTYMGNADKLDGYSVFPTVEKYLFRIGVSNGGPAKIEIYVGTVNVSTWQDRQLSKEIQLIQNWYDSEQTSGRPVFGLQPFVVSNRVETYSDNMVACSSLMTDLYYDEMRIKAFRKLTKQQKDEDETVNATYTRFNNTIHRLFFTCNLGFYTLTSILQPFTVLSALLSFFKGPLAEKIKGLLELTGFPEEVYNDAKTSYEKAFPLPEKLRKEKTGVNGEKVKKGFVPLTKEHVENVISSNSSVTLTKENKKGIKKAWKLKSNQLAFYRGFNGTTSSMIIKNDKVRVSYETKKHDIALKKAKKANDEKLKVKINRLTRYYNESLSKDFIYFNTFLLACTGSQNPKGATAIVEYLKKKDMWEPPEYSNAWWATLSIRDKIAKVKSIVAEMESKMENGKQGQYNLSSVPKFPDFITFLEDESHLLGGGTEDMKKLMKSKEAIALFSSLLNISQALYPGWNSNGKRKMQLWRSYCMMFGILRNNTGSNQVERFVTAKALFNEISKEDKALANIFA